MTSPASDPMSSSAAELSASQFARIAKIAKTSWGLDLDAAKTPLVRARLNKRLRALNCANFDEYCTIVERGNSAEEDHFVSALTTNVTHFFREPHHFEQFEEQDLPGLVARAKAGERVRLWSAGCSSGEEPYSIAATIFAACPQIASYDLKILATDIDLDILERAQSGEYTLPSPNNLSPERHTQLFGPAKSAEGSAQQVRPELRALVTFRRLNLVGSWPMSGIFDVIFCRNVAIYFDKPTQANLWSRFSEILKPAGSLFIGHSERIADPASIGVEASGITAYKKAKFAI